MAIASEKIKARIMTMNIFEEAEGLRAIDLTAEKPTKAMTAAGPAVLKIMTSANANVDIYEFYVCAKTVKLFERIKAIPSFIGTHEPSKTIFPFASLITKD